MLIEPISLKIFITEILSIQFKIDPKIDIRGIMGFISY
jgi:hypothetical protein